MPLPTSQKPHTSHDSPKADRLLALLLVISTLVGLSAVFIFREGAAGRSLFTLSNLVGPTTWSLMHGDGLTDCAEVNAIPDNYNICFHAARMPLPSLVLALGISLFGDHFLPVNLFKALLLLLPLEFAIYLVWRRMPRSGPHRTLSALLLLVPFAITSFLADIVNMQVEEGYSYGLLALAVAILLFAAGPTPSLSRALLFAIAVDGVYLAKSSMAPAVAVLVLGYLLLERSSHPTRLLVVVLVAAAPIGWALHQHHASQHYSFGTSLDGINLHKGNNPGFLAHYPPTSADGSIDRYDAELSRGLRFDNEWALNDYHRRAAFAYMSTHPAETFTGDLRKLQVVFLSLRKYGSSQTHGALRFAEAAGLLVFHLILWIALAGALFYLIKSPIKSSDPADPSSPRLIGAIFLALVAACILPYLLGFAYTRHVSVLIYPAALMCCRMLQDGESGQAIPS